MELIGVEIDFNTQNFLQETNMEEVDEFCIDASLALRDFSQEFEEFGNVLLTMHQIEDPADTYSAFHL